MTDVLQHLKQRKLVQWAVAYVAFAFALIQVIDVVADSYDWPHLWMHLTFGALALGFVVTLLLAWYHGERGAQRISGPELLLIALALAIGGGLLWHFGHAGPAVPDAEVVPASSLNAGRGLDGAQRNAGKAAPASAVSVAAAGLQVPAVVQPIPAKSIAVLPFENLSVDKANAYFADGMQDLILTRLADIGDLKVIARTATEKYQSHPEDLKSIGRELGVATFLEGSVQKAGREVLINVQLIDANTDAHIWARSYTRSLDNIFGVEGEVAGKVAEALNARLTASETSAVAHVPTTNPQAYDDYLRALYFDNEASKGDWTTFLPQAIAAASKAVAEDPAFALAWAELGGARIDAHYWGGDRSQANLRAAEVAAKRALALAPNLPEAHLAMAGIERFVHHDLVAAREQIQQAVDLRPNDADALSNLAIADANLGIGGEEGMKLIERAIALDPTNSAYEIQFGWELASKGNYAAARQAERRALAIDPQDAQAYLALSQIDIAQDGDVDAATKVLDDMVPGTPVNAQVASMRIDLLLYQRQIAAARALAEDYSEKFSSGGAAITMTLARANIEWLLGKPDRARALYRTAIGLTNPSATQITMGDHVGLGLAYARLDDADSAMKQFAVAAKPGRSQNVSARPIIKYVLAKAQLALGRKSAAIDTLGQFAVLENQNLTVWGATPALLRLDPTWDPIRHDPRFQALLKKYANTAPAAASSTTIGQGVGP